MDAETVMKADGKNGNDRRVVRGKGTEGTKGCEWGRADGRDGKGLQI
jgi:hypothetical protein